MRNKPKMNIISFEKFKKQKRMSAFLKRIPSPTVLIIFFVLVMGLIALIGYKGEATKHHIDEPRETEVVDPIEYPFLK